MIEVGWGEVGGDVIEEGWGEVGGDVIEVGWGEVRPKDNPRGNVRNKAILAKNVHGDNYSTIYAYRHNVGFVKVTELFPLQMKTTSTSHLAKMMETAIAITAQATCICRTNYSSLVLGGEE